MIKRLIVLLCIILVAVGCFIKPDKEMNQTSQVISEEVTYEKDAIHKAAHQGDLELVKAILKTSPDIDIRDSFGGTPLHAAMFQENMEVITVLINYGYDVDAKGTSNGYTPLHDAVWSDNLEAVKLLVESGATIDIENNSGKTPLDKARDENKAEIVKYLESQ